MSSTVSWLTNSALVYEPKCWGMGGGGVSANEHNCAHGAQINFGDLTPYLTKCPKASILVLIYFLCIISAGPTYPPRPLLFFTLLFANFPTPFAWIFHSVLSLQVLTFFLTVYSLSECFSSSPFNYFTLLIPSCYYFQLSNKFHSHFYDFFSSLLQLPSASFFTFHSLSPYIWKVTFPILP